MSNYQPPRTPKSPHPRPENSLCQKAEALYQLTCAFCRRFLPPHADRTAAQMMQAAHSSMQKIAESAEGIPLATETHRPLLGDARKSLHGLRQAYTIYLQDRQLATWTTDHPRFVAMQTYCRQHNRAADYAPFFGQWSSEEMANTALTLCHQTDAMLGSRLRALEHGGEAQSHSISRPPASPTAAGRQQSPDLLQLLAEVARLQALLEENGIAY